jgi:hypothetical protein
VTKGRRLTAHASIRPIGARVDRPPGNDWRIDNDRVSAGELPTPVKLLKSLEYAIKRKAAYPLRPEIHKRLAKVEDAARLLEHELADPQILALLSNGDPRLENWLSDMARTARRLTSRVAEFRERHPQKQGRGKLYPEAGPDPLEICALMISMLWQQDNGRLPGKGNVKAHKFCEDLWLAAGGTPHAGLAARPGTLTAWCSHLLMARKYGPPHPAGEHVVRRRRRGG